MLVLFLVWSAPSFAAEMSSANFTSRNGVVSNGSGTAASASFSVIGLSHSSVDDIGRSAQFVNTVGVLPLDDAAPVFFCDLNSDSKVDVTDALRALSIEIGLAAPNAADWARGDVAPIVNGVPQPDGKIDIGDVVVILRRAVGLKTW